MLVERKRERRRLGAAESCRERLQQPAEAEQQDEPGDDAGGDRGGDGALLRGRDGEREQRKAACSRRDDEAKRRPFLLVGEMGAHQHCRRHDAGAAQRQKHEEQHGEEAGASSGQQRHWMRLDGESDGQGVAIGRRQQSRGERAEHEPEDDAETGEHQRLDEIDGKHEPARSAQAS